MTKPCVLLTGFGPFPGVPQNPSGWLAEKLAERASLQGLNVPGLKVEGVILPTEWETIAAEAPRLLSQWRPHLAIHFGVSAKANGLRLERAAHNSVKALEDARGALPKRQEVLAGRPPRQLTALPVTAIAAQLRKAGIKARVSNSCGRYLCNDLYYRSLALRRAQGEAEYERPAAGGRNAGARLHGEHRLFVHVPLTEGPSAKMDRQELLHAGEKLLQLTTQALWSPHIADRATTRQNRDKTEAHTKPPRLAASLR